MASAPNRSRAEQLHDLIERSEDDLIARVLAYAQRFEFTRYTSTLAEAWRASISGLSEPLLRALEASDRVPELHPDEDYARDPVAAFGILEAQRHRTRGIGFGMFLGLMKYYRQSYLDLIDAAGFAPEDEKWALLYVRRVFDRVELGYCVEWNSEGGDSQLAGLQAANRALANEKNKYLTLFSSLGPPVLLLDRGDRVTGVNFAAEQLLFGGGRPGATYYGADSLHDLPPCLADAVETFHREGEPQMRSSMVALGSGSARREFEVVVRSMLDVSGKFSGSTVVLNDMTDRLRLERRLLETNNVLEQRVAERTRELQSALESLRQEAAEKDRVAAEHHQLDARMRDVQRLESLGVLAGGVAHDFNNLLTIILGNTQLVACDLPNGTPAAERLAHVKVAAQHAADLCRQMLTYSGRGTLQARDVDLADLVRDMPDLLQAAVSKSSELRVRFAPCALMVRGDESQLRQVVLNLVRNAAEAVGGGSGTIEIGIDSAYCTRLELDATIVGIGLPEGDYVILSVSDDGCGMDSATRGRIFEPFFSTKFVGRGLGLAAVLGIVRSHSGTIGIWSEIGEGTTFRVFFPALSSGRPVATAQVIPDSASILPGGGRTVLLVDDDPMVLAMSAQMLSSGGWQVLEASNGREALATWASHREAIAMILMDVTMPGLDGPATLAALRAKGCEVPAVMVTGYDEVEIGGRCEGLGVGAVVHKPFTPAELLGALAAHSAKAG
jgi:signal transduction histidine kinase/ActR/RegA family two-component response regulator